jgi:hypothetical protein
VYVEYHLKEKKEMTLFVCANRQSQVTVNNWPLTLSNCKLKNNESANKSVNFDLNQIVSLQFSYQ